MGLTLEELQPVGWVGFGESSGMLQAPLEFPFVSHSAWSHHLASVGISPLSVLLLLGLTPHPPNLIFLARNTSQANKGTVSSDVCGYMNELTCFIAVKMVRLGPSPL